MDYKYIFLYFWPNAVQQRVIGQNESVEPPVLRVGEQLRILCVMNQFSGVARAVPEDQIIELVGCDLQAGQPLFYARQTDDPATNQVNVPGDWFGGQAQRSRGQLSFRLHTLTREFMQAVRQETVPRLQLFLLGRLPGTLEFSILGSTPFEGRDIYALRADAAPPCRIPAATWQELIARGQRAPDYRYASASGGAWLSAPPLNNRYWQRREAEVGWGDPLPFLWRSGLRIDRSGSEEQRLALTAAARGDDFCFYAEDSGLWYRWRQDRWSAGVPWRGATGTRSGALVETVVFPTVRHAEFGVVGELDEVTPRLFFMADGSGFRRVRFGWHSANAAVGGQVVLQLCADGEVLERREVAVAAQVTFQEWVLPPAAGRPRHLVLERRCGDAADTLRADGEAVALEVVSWTVEAEYALSHGLQQMTQSAHCIAAVDPDHGGCWLAPLRPGEPGAPWPSRILRNFADEPANWCDFAAAVTRLGVADFELTLDFTCLPHALASFDLFGNRGQEYAIGIVKTADHDYNIRLVAYEGNQPGGSNHAMDIGAGAHRLIFRCVGAAAQIILDDVVRLDYQAGALPRIPCPVTLAPASDFPGCFSDITLKNLTTNETVWHYPSEAERTRLLTYENMRTDRGCFEAADKNRFAIAETQLDVRESTRSWTVFADVELPMLPVTAANVVYNVCGQGQAIDESGVLALAVGVWNRTPMLQFRVATALASLEGEAILALQGKRTRLCGVFDLTTQKISLYVDGVLVDQKTHEFHAVPAAATTPAVFAAVGGKGGNRVTRPCVNVYTSQVYDYALSAAEIRALSPALDPVHTWLVPVTAGVVDIKIAGFKNLVWIFPDGSISTDSAIKRNVTAGVLVCRYSGLAAESSLTLGSSSASALKQSVIKAADLPRVTNVLTLQYLSQLTGTFAELPRVTGQMGLQHLPLLTGTTADLPRTTGAILTLNNLPLLTGTTDDLPRASTTMFLFALPQLTGTTDGLPRVTTTLSMNQLPNLTGTTAGLPRVSTQLTMYECPQVSGTTEDLPRVAEYLHVAGFPLLSGTIAGLPRVTRRFAGSRLPLVTGSIADAPAASNELTFNGFDLMTGNAVDLPPGGSDKRGITLCPLVTGALSVQANNKDVWSYSNAAVTPDEYDQTIQNIVDAGGTKGKLSISSTRTAASDANLQILRDRGWTVTEE